MLLLIQWVLAEERITGEEPIRPTIPKPQLEYVPTYLNPHMAWEGNYLCKVGDQSWALTLDPLPKEPWWDGRFFIDGPDGRQRGNVRAYVNASDPLWLDVQVVSLNGKGPLTGNGDLGITLVSLKGDGEKVVGSKPGALKMSCGR